MIHALEKNGMIYRIAFASPDHQAHLEAAKLGIGLTALPKRLLDSSLVQAKEYYLPPLSSPKLFLAVRAGHDIGNHEFANAFASSLFDSPGVKA